MLQRPEPRQSGDETPSHRPRMPKVGVVVFDNSRDMMGSGGWACLPEGNSFRIRQPSDLPNDCIFVSTVDGMDFRRRLGKFRNLRPSGWMHSSLKHVGADLGLPIDGEGRFGAVSDVVAPKLSKVAHRTALIAAQVYGWTDPAQMLVSENLYEDILRSLVPPPPVRSFMKPALLSAYQSYSSPDWSDDLMSDSISVTLRLNRLTHAKNIMATKVPDGSWTLVDSGMRLEDALDPSGPCLVEAVVETSDIDPSISSLIAFGAQPGRRNMLRSWMCQRELQWVSQYAKVHIMRAYRAASSASLPERVQLPEVLMCDPAFELSLSAGLVAESHWAALCNPIYVPKAPDKKEVSPWGVWLRATDRAISFNLAMAAFKAGFHVFGYGNGSVVLRLPRTDLPKLLDFAMEHEIAHPLFRELFERNGLMTGGDHGDQS